MKVVITGAAGTLGRALAKEVLDRGSLRSRKTGELVPVEELTLIDAAEMDEVPEGGTFLKADLTSPGALSVLSAGPDAVFHLAHAPPQAAEDNFDLGMKVNGTVLQGLLTRCRRSEAVPVVVFPSSHLVHGPSGSLDPETSFGAQKLSGELLVRDMTRKGYIDGRVVRLPFLSYQAEGSPLAWVQAAAGGAGCAVPADTPVRLITVEAAAAALLHAHDVGKGEWAEKVGRGAVCLPGAAATAGGLAALAGGSCGGDEAAAGFARALPAELDGSAASALGFDAPETLEAIVAAAAA